MKETVSITTKYGTFETKAWYSKSDKIWYAQVPTFRNDMTHGTSRTHALKMIKEVIELNALCALDE
jgi:predicted RNase H-like HicB family nuclease